MSEERKKHTAQLEIINGYRNKIVMDNLQVEDILKMLDFDYEYLEQENAVINVNDILEKAEPVKPVEGEGKIIGEFIYDFENKTETYISHINHPVTPSLQSGVEDAANSFYLLCIINENL